MSRSGYMDDVEPWDLIRWRGQVAATMRGKRGQAFLLEMWKAMQALPAPVLIKDALVEPDGAVCAIGSVGKARGMDMSQLDPHESQSLAAAFGIPYQLAQEIMYMNDEARPNEVPQARFERMREWIELNLRPVVDPEATEQS